jgi:hypothetical protein
MRRLAALLFALALVPACEHMGHGGSGGFGHSSYGGGGGGGGAFHPSGAHAPSSSLGAPSGYHESTASKVGNAVAAGTAAAVLQAAGVGTEGDDDDSDGTTDSVAAQPVSRAPVGDLCLDCPDAGNCSSCQSPRGVP